MSMESSQQPQVTQFQSCTFKAPSPGQFLGYLLSHDSLQAQYVDEELHGSTSPSTLGAFHKIPTEVQLRIVSLLDIETVIKLRQLGLTARELVDESLDFQTVRAFPCLLSAVLLLRCQFYDLGTLAAAVRDNVCQSHGCDSYGDFFYLLTAERLCYCCFRQRLQYVPKAVRGTTSSSTSSSLQADNQAVLAELLSAGIPCAIIPTGRYGMSGLGIVSQEQVVMDRRYLHRMRGLHLQTSPVHDPSVSTEHADENAKTRISYAPHCLEDSDPEGPRQAYFKNYTSIFHPYPWTRAAPLSARYTVVLPAPYWDPATRTFRDGVFCRACVANAELNAHSLLKWWPQRQFWDFPFRRYAGEADFAAHVAECGPVREDPASGKLVHAFDPSKSGFEWPDDMYWARWKLWVYMRGRREYAGQGPGRPIMDFKLCPGENIEEIWPRS